MDFLEEEELVTLVIVLSSFPGENLEVQEST